MPTDDRQLIQVIFRYDDCSGRSPAGFERQLLEIFKSADVPCLFGIIPLICADDELDSRPQEVIPLGLERSSELRKWIKEGVVEPALHGFNHQNNGLFPGNPGEFAGLPYTEQERRIREGRRLLEDALGIEVTTFIPPFNRFDEETVRVLEREGFICVSSALFDEAVHVHSSLCFAPHTCSLLQAQSAIANMTTLNVDGALVMPLFHPADFVEVNSDGGRFSLERLAELLFSLKTNPRICFARIGDNCSTFSSERFLTNRTWMNAVTGGGLPVLSPERFPRTALLPAPFAEEMLHAAIVRSRLLCVGGLLSGVVSGLVVALLLPSLSPLPWVVLALIAFYLLIRVGHRLAFNHKLVLWAGLGVGIGGGVLL